MKNRTMRKTKRAFTLVEMLVVVIIIGILGSILGPKLIKMIDKSNLAAATTNTKDIAKSVEQINIADFTSDSGFKAGTDDVQKPAGQLGFRKVADDTFITGNYLTDIDQNGTTLDQVIKTSYDIEPAEFTVGDNPTITNYGDKRFYILVDYDATNDVITGQLTVYCQKTTKYQGIDEYEKSWTMESKRNDDAAWVNTLKTNAETAGYNCIPKTITYTN